MQTELRKVWFDLCSMYFKKFKPILKDWAISPIEIQILQREDLATLGSCFLVLGWYPREQEGVLVDLRDK